MLICANLKKLDSFEDQLRASGDRQEHSHIRGDIELIYLNPWKSLDFPKLVQPLLTVLLHFVQD